MKTITINNKQHKISAALERAIVRVSLAGPLAISDFEEGVGRNRKNPVAKARNLEDQTAGALTLALVTRGYLPSKIPAKCLKARPCVQKWVLPNTRRLNLVVKKLRAAGEKS